MSLPSKIWFLRDQELVNLLYMERRAKLLRPSLLRIQSARILVYAIKNDRLLISNPGHQAI